MTTAKSAEGGAPQAKRARVATVSYPYHSLELCVELAKAVREIGNGRSDVTKSQLAHRLGLSEQSSDFAQKIASSKTYGLIDGKATLRLTEPSNRFFFPTDDGEQTKKLCLFKFLESPGAFKALIERYDGSRPASLEIMANILGQNYGIPESWKSRVAAFFIRSAQYAGAITADGFLRFKAQIDGLGAALPPTIPATNQNGLPTPEIPSTATPMVQVQNKQNQEGVTVWTHGISLRVETPVNMTKEVWEKLNKYIQAIEP